MAVKASKTWRGFTLASALAFDSKTGELLDKNLIFKKLESDILALQALAQWQIDAHGQELLKTIDEYDQKPNAAGLYMKLYLPDEIKQTLFTGKSGFSRFEKIWRGEIITTLRSWKARSDVANGVNTTYASAGFKRTARDSKPQIAAKMNLGYADPQYVEWASRSTLSLVIDGERYHLMFDMPQKYAFDTISVPTIRVTKDGLKFDFAVSQDYQQKDLSERYIVGVDVGLVQPATVSVWDSQEEKIVESSTLSQRVGSLKNSIAATLHQLKYLRKKSDRLMKESRYAEYAEVRKEIRQQRSSSVGKKCELAIIIGQEVADLAFKYNAAVAVEDLSWIKNTMSSGRWNRGEVVKWIRHFAEQNGSRVLTVNAAYTSQECAFCDLQVVFRKRVVFCRDCGIELDRDENAAANIAQRAVKNVATMVASRKKSKRYSKGKPEKVSPQSRKSLKRPGLDRKKRGQTSKRPINKKSPRQAVILRTVDNVWRDDSRSATQDSKKAASIYSLTKLQPLSPN